jgi:antitoxin HigA-1
LGECVIRVGLSIADAGKALGIMRATASERVNRKCGISPEMAVRLSRVFGGSAESWQAHYDRGRSARTASGSSGCMRLFVNDISGPNTAGGEQRSEERRH